MQKLAVSCSIALALIGAGATRASAQGDIPGSPFHIDGVITDFDNSGIPGGYTVPPCDPPAVGGAATGAAPQACKQIDANGNTQELGPKNSNTTKIGVIHNAAVPMLNTTNPNAQVDLSAGWIQSAIASVNGSPHVFLYFGWRRDNNTGSGFISLEIQKASAGGPADNCEYDSPTFNPNLCNPWAGRQAGDVIFLWDQQGGSTTIIGAAITGPAGFHQVLNVPDCSHSGECEDLSVQNKAFAQFGTDCGTGFQAGQCGEMVVDLTALGVFPTSPTSCVGIGNMIPGTVTGNSNTADYKDVILAPFPRISNCGTITVTKKTYAPDGTTLLVNTNTNFNYTIDRNGGGALRFPLVGGQTTITDSLTGCVNTTTCGGPVDTHADIIAGTDYKILESGPPPPWVLISIACTVDGNPVSDGDPFEVKVDKTTACVISNKLVLTDVTPASHQRAKVSDSVQLSGILAGGTSNPSPALARETVRVKLYSVACGSAGTELASFDLALTFSTPDASGKQTASTGFTVPDYVTETNSTFFWSIRWDGDSFNNPVTEAQSCSTPGEKVQIIFTPVQQ
jgi:hypothetical protein